METHKEPEVTRKEEETDGQTISRLREEITGLKDQIDHLREDLTHSHRETMAALNNKDQLQAEILMYAHDAERWRAAKGVINVLSASKQSERERWDALLEVTRVLDEARRHP